MTQTEMPTEWKNWVSENLNRGCDPHDICQRLVDHGFGTQTIQKAMGAHYPHKFSASPSQDTGTELPFDETYYHALAKPRLTRSENGLTGVSRFPTDKIQLYLMENCLDNEECDALVSLIRQYNRPSTITTQETETDKLFRTSSTCDMSRLKEDIVPEIDAKICRILGIQAAYSEGIQGQHYEVGQEFKAHTDFFTRGTDEFRRFASQMGQRTWTFMIYLNDTEQGGGTHFTKIDEIFYPKKGLAVIWNNILPNGVANQWTEHWARPVEKGTKTIITKWFREKSNDQLFFPAWT